MNEGWIIFGLCALTLIGATLPLLHEKHSQRKKLREPPNPPEETAHDRRIPPDRS